MFRTRLITGIGVCAAMILTIRAGGFVLLAILCALSLIGIVEFYRAAGLMEGAPERTEGNRARQGRGRQQGTGPLPVVGIVSALAWYAVLAVGREELFVPCIALGTAALMTVYVLTYPRYHVEETAKAAFGFLYAAVLLSCVYLTRITDEGIIHVWLILISAWGSDTFAYCVGMLIGKHKMTPRLSPKKSWEGAAGGVLGSVLLGCLFALIFKQPVFEYGIICFFGAILSMIGDLAASAVKRDNDIKDYGNVFPGHGGVLDRFDSILFTAPVILALTHVLL